MDVRYADKLEELLRLEPRQAEGEVTDFLQQAPHSVYANTLAVLMVKVARLEKLAHTRHSVFTTK